MKFQYLLVCIGVAMFGSFITAPTVEAAGDETPRPWTETDQRELRRIVDDHVLPGSDAVTSAMQLLSDNSGEACASAQLAQFHIMAADKAVKALNERITAEGKDMAPLATANRVMTAMVPRLPVVVDKVCNGEPTGTPERQADARILLDFSVSSSLAMQAAGEARKAGNTQAYCTSLGEARAASRARLDFAANLMVKYRDSDPDFVAELGMPHPFTDELNARIDQMLAECTAR